MRSSRTYISFATGQKGTSDEISVSQVHEYATSVGNKTWFRSVTLSLAHQNKGCANSIIGGVSSVLESHKEVIVLEDDHVTTAGFIEYMNDALRFFEQSSNIWSISGYALPLRLPLSYPHDLYVTPRACAWGWGTWRDRWVKVDWDVSGYQSFRHDIWKRWTFNRGGWDMSRMLDAQMRGAIDAWDIRWCYAQHLDRSMTVYPSKSYVMNIGTDGTGTHGVVSSRYQPVLAEADHVCQFELTAPNRTILRRFRHFFVHPVRYIARGLRSRALRLLGKSALKSR